MSAPEKTVRDVVMSYVEALGLSAVIVGATWGFYMALKMLFGA